MTAIPEQRNVRKMSRHGDIYLKLSPASDYITGQTIFLDGGWTAK